VPKLKPNDQELKNRIIRGHIAKNMELQATNDEAVAIRLHITRQTFQNKKRHPETFKLGELQRMCSILKFSDEEKTEIL